MDLQTYLLSNTQTDLAERLGVSHSLVNQWLSGLTRITAERAVQIERVTNGAIGRHELRPDLFHAPRVKRGSKTEVA